MNLQLGACKFCGAPRVYQRLIDAARPCAACVERMQRGVLLIEIVDGDEQDEPERTGVIYVVDPTKVARLFNDPFTVATALQQRWLYVPHTVWERLGIPQLV